MNFFFSLLNHKIRNQKRYFKMSGRNKFHQYFTSIEEFATDTNIKKKKTNQFHCG